MDGGVIEYPVPFILPISFNFAFQHFVLLLIVRNMQIGKYLWLIVFLLTCWQILLQLDSKSEAELREEDEEDYAMNSESYMEVSCLCLRWFG